MRQHERATKTKVTPKKRKAVMLALCGQSKRETERFLATEFSLPLASVPVVQRETGRGTTRVTIEFSAEEMKIFDEIKRLSGRPQNMKATVLRLAAKELTLLRKARGEMPVRGSRVRRPRFIGQDEQSPSPAKVTAQNESGLKMEKIERDQAVGPQNTGISKTVRLEKSRGTV